MAIIICPDCGGDASTLAYDCPHCGRPVRKRPPVISAVPKKSRWLVKLVVLLGIVIAAVYFYEANNGANERRPWNAGKGFVLRQLRAPTTAKFPSAYASDVGWKSTGHNRWKVWGFVDSQNAFGVMIRNDWQAVVEKRGADWHRLYLPLGDEEVGDHDLFQQ